MAEWIKAAVLKTVVAKVTVGSNPTPTAIIKGEGRKAKIKRYDDEAKIYCPLPIPYSLLAILHIGEVRERPNRAAC